MHVIKKAVVALCMGVTWLAGGLAAATLPIGLDAPDHGVVCHREGGVCYDRYGPSIGLTEAFMGSAAANRLTTALRERPTERQPGAVFSPAEGVECVHKTGPCRVQGAPHAALTAVLYGPWPPRLEHGAEARAIVGADWRWLGTRYNNDTEVRPAEPARYTLHLAPDGAVRVHADCNGAGGQYRLAGSRITIEVTHTTMAACESGSLDGVFLQDLAAAAGYFMQHGQLYLDLQYDTGTMEFAR